MVVDKNIALRRLCQIIGADDAASLPDYVRDRVEREVQPLLNMPMLSPDSPAVMDVVEGIGRDYVMLAAARRIDEAAADLRDAAGGARDRQAMLERRQAGLDARQEALDNALRVFASAGHDIADARLDLRDGQEAIRQTLAELHCRLLTMDEHQRVQDARQASLDLERQILDRRQQILDAKEGRLAALEDAKNRSFLSRLAGVLGLGDDDEPEEVQTPAEAGESDVAHQQPRRNQ